MICKEREDRRDIIRLYITRAGHSIKDRINVEAIQGDAALFYEINYDAVWNNLGSSAKQLQLSDDIPGIYFFQTNGNKNWDETPFEFDQTVKKEFSFLSELPFVRKKGAVGKYSFPVAKAETKAKAKIKKASQKELSVQLKKPIQPKYGLKYKIEFTDLDKIVFEDTQMSKREVLDYYHKIAIFILPYLKDRPLSVRIKGEREEIRTTQELADRVTVPEWIDILTKEGVLLCNDKEHLMWYVEIGCVEFCCSLSRVNSLNSADFCIMKSYWLKQDSGDILNALTAIRMVLEGLQFPYSVRKTNRSVIDIYVPLDSGCTFEISNRLSEYLCKLVRLKVPHLVILDEPEADGDGKMLLNYLINEPDHFFAVPYSFVEGNAPAVALPFLLPGEEKDDTLPDQTYSNVLKNLIRYGDVFLKPSKKKIAGAEMLARLESRYSFLLS